MEKLSVGKEMAKLTKMKGRLQSSGSQTLAFT